MICKLTGRLTQLRDGAATLEVGPIGYEILLPSSSLASLGMSVGAEVTLSIYEYLEGNPAQSHLIPRRLGFTSDAEREFFLEFLKVRGVGMRKALRAMHVPAHQIAAAIESGDERTLTTLPEVGKKLAATIVAELRGKLERFLAPATAPLAGGAALTEPQRVAVEILVQWGDRRVDAQRWVGEIVASHPDLSSPEDIVRRVYRLKQGATA